MVHVPELRHLTSMAASSGTPDRHVTPSIANDSTSVGARLATVRGPAGSAFFAGSERKAWLGLRFLGLRGDHRHVVLGDHHLGGGVDVLGEATLDSVLPDHDGTQKSGDEAEGQETQDHAPRTHVGSNRVKSGRTGKW